MMAETAAQGHMKAQALPGEYLQLRTWGGAGRVFELNIRAAAQQGDAQSQSNVGVVYRDGRGCEQSHERVAEWWSKAAELGYASAQHNRVRMRRATCPAELRTR